MENISVPVTETTTISISPETHQVGVTQETASIEIYSPGGPRGPQGPPGAGLLIKGTVPTAADLPSGQKWGDLWIALDTGHGWVWQYPNEWVDVGPIQGAPGQPGAPGPPGPAGQGLAIKGSVATHSDLPSSGNVYGDLWITLDTSHGWLWESPGTWTDTGAVQGPPGPAGAPGAAGAQGEPGESTISQWTGTFVPPVGAGSSTLAFVAPATWAAVGMNTFVASINPPGSEPVLIGTYRITAVSPDQMVITVVNLPGAPPPGAGSLSVLAPV